MDWMNLVESLFRWMHVVAGILWVGLLYFFNWVNSAFAPTMDPQTRQKVVPELLPRTLYWFRWGAAWTWVTGLVLISMVYYHAGLVFEGGIPNWGAPVFLGIAITFLSVFVYDALYRTAFRNPVVGFIAGLVLASGVMYFDRWAGFSFRGYAIHLGAMFGTYMAFNVWFRIWPAQRKIILAIKNGEAPDPSLVVMAGTRSKHNTYMSAPLVFAMVSQHATWAASPGKLSIIIFAGWMIIRMLYKRAAKVRGF